MSTWTSIIRDINKNQPETRKKDFLIHKIRYWDPKERPVYYFKTLLLFLFNNLNQLTVNKFFKSKYKTILKKEYSILINKNYIDFDFIQSCYEYEFLEKYLIKSKKILEIGSGYGRTCYFIMSIFKNIESYTIVDFEEINKKYSMPFLKRNLSSKYFSKIKFLNINELNKITKFDLAINIDSMQEMDEKDINKYLDIISEKGKLFYSSNALAKYKPEYFGLKKLNKRKLSDALNSGKNKVFANVFNSKEFNKKLIKDGLNNYCPNNFKIKEFQINKTIPFYADCIYKKN